MQMKQDKNKLHQISKCYLSLDQNYFSDKILYRQKKQQEKSINTFQMNQKRNAKLIARYKYKLNKKIVQKEFKSSSQQQSVQKIWLDFLQKTDETLTKKPKTKSFYDLYRETLEHKRIFIKQNQNDLKQTQNYLQDLKKSQYNQSKKIVSRKKNKTFKTIQYPPHHHLDELNKKHSALNIKMMDYNNFSFADEAYQPHKEGNFVKLNVRRKFHTSGVQQIQKLDFEQQHLEVNKNIKQKLIKDKVTTQQVRGKSVDVPQQQFPKISKKEMNKTRHIKFQISKGKKSKSHQIQEKKINNQHNHNIGKNKIQPSTKYFRSLNSQKAPGSKIVHGYGLHAQSRYQGQEEEQLSLQYRIKSYKSHESVTHIPLNNIQKQFTYMVQCQQQSEEKQRKFQNQSTNNQRKTYKDQKISEDNGQNKFEVLVQKGKRNIKMKMKILSFKNKQTNKNINIMNGSVSGWRAFQHKFDDPY